MSNSILFWIDLPINEQSPILHRIMEPTSLLWPKAVVGVEIEFALRSTAVYPLILFPELMKSLAVQLVHSAEPSRLKKVMTGLRTRKIKNGTKPKKKTDAA